MGTWSDENIMSTPAIPKHVHTHMYMHIVESVDSLCKDGTNTPIVRVIGKPCKLANTHSLSLSAPPAILLQCFSTQKYPPSS